MEEYFQYFRKGYKNTVKREGEGSKKGRKTFGGGVRNRSERGGREGGNKPIMIFAGGGYLLYIFFDCEKWMPVKSELHAGVIGNGCL